MGERKETKDSKCCEETIINHALNPRETEGNGERTDTKQGIQALQRYEEGRPCNCCQREK